MARFDLNSYVDVQTRIGKFWDEYPEGAIRTSLESNPEDFKTCRYRAEVYKDASNERPDATGYAFEIAGEGMANKTSHEENAETSAIGRALANLGYATSNKDRPSREEMGKVQRMSAPAPTGPMSDADFLTFVSNAGKNAERWKEAVDLSGSNPDRWKLLIEKAPSEAWRKRFEELMPEAAKA